MSEAAAKAKRLYLLASCPHSPDGLGPPTPISRANLSSAATRFSVDGCVAELRRYGRQHNDGLRPLD